MAIIILFLYHKRLYKAHIDSNTLNVFVAYNEFRKLIDIKIAKITREETINNFLEMSYADNYVDQAKKLRSYREYIDYNIGNMSTIKKEIDAIVFCDDRKKMLTSLIAKFIAEEHMEKIKKHQLYTNYISNGNDLIKTARAIVNMYNEHHEVGNRQKLIDKKLRSHAIVVTNKINKIMRYYVNYQIISLDYAVELMEKVDIITAREMKLNEIIRNNPLNLNVLMTNHPKYFRYMYNIKLRLDDFETDIKNDMDSLMKTNILNNIAYDDIKTLNKALLDFHNSDNKNIFMTRNRPETRLYIKYLCDQYDFLYVGEDSNCYIWKILNVNSTNSSYIQQIMKIQKKSKLANDRIMKSYNNIINDI